ncbi:MAG: hypothetical protein Roseis2KO_43910 [Roseivirga sp.]
MTQKLTTLLLASILFSTFCQHSVQAQSLKKSAQHVRAALTAFDLDKFMALYADSVRYQDPNYGSDDTFSKATVRSFFEPIFVSGSTFDLKLQTVAIDHQEESIIIRGDTYDTTEKKRLPFLVFLKFEKGKIINQIDFPVYAIESLRNAPRYQGYFKEKEGN